MFKGGQYQWWMVLGGSVSYVEKFVIQLQWCGVVLWFVMLVCCVQCDVIGVMVQVDGVVQWFDQVIMVCYVDQMLVLLVDFLLFECVVFGVVWFQDNCVVLYVDLCVMFVCRVCWSLWIYCVDDL